MAISVKTAEQILEIKLIPQATWTEVQEQVRGDSIVTTETSQFYK